MPRTPWPGNSAQFGDFGALFRLRIPSGSLAERVEAVASRAHFSRAYGVGDRPLTAD